MGYFGCLDLFMRGTFWVLLWRATTRSVLVVYGGGYPDYVRHDSGAAHPAARVAGMVNHSQDEDVVFPLHVEDPKRKLMEIGATDILMDDGKTLGVGPDLQEDAIQIVPKREVQTVAFLGVPALGRQDIPFRRS